jgi:hypothetical protein
MTCIVGLVDGGHVYIGGDTIATDANWNCTSRVDSKVFLKGAYVIGFTTSYRMGQVLRYEADIPDPSFGAALMQHMVVDFVGAVRVAFQRAGFTKLENGREEGGYFLVGVQGRLFCIGNDFQVGEPRAGFDAVGVGSAYAHGALAVTSGDPVRRLRRALAVSERFSAGVGGPFDVMRTP